MILKKFYANTIREALKEAKEKLGEDIVLLESIPPEPEEDRPAAVTIMLDKEEKEKPSPQQEEDNKGFRNVLYKRSDVRKNIKKGQDITKSGQHTVVEEQQDPAKDAKEKSASPKKKETDEKKLKKTTKKGKSDSDSDQKDDLPEPKGLDDPSSGMSRRKQSLIELTSEKSPKNGFYNDSSVSREISALHRRFDQVESMLGEALISANLDYASHDAFQQLLDAGIRATTVSRWFKTILNKGIDPYENRESFMYELAKIVRDVLTITLPDAVQPNLVFVGPSGSGKTTMIMKLASNPDFMGEKKVALVTVNPRKSYKQYTPLGLFAEEYGIDYFTVKDGIDVSKLMQKLVNYDHVLFDTPSISLEKKTAFREYWKIRQILASVMPLEVHFVINATMENYYFREAYATNHPLQPDYVAITHLDETSRWGHLIPFLKTLGCSVRYMTQGPEIPDAIDAFSPTWFAEKILSYNR